MSSSAAFPGPNQQTHNRVAVEIRDPLRAADRVAFQQELEGHRNLRFRQVAVQHPLVRLGIRPLAGEATEPAKSIAVHPEPLARVPQESQFITDWVSLIMGIEYSKRSLFVNAFSRDSAVQAEASNPRRGCGLWWPSNCSESLHPLQRVGVITL